MKFGFDSFGGWVEDTFAMERRGEVLQVDWDEVSGFSLSESEQGAANLLAVFEKLRPADLARQVAAAVRD